LPASINTAIVTISTTPTQILPTVPGRVAALIINESTTLIRLGGSNTVTTANGAALANTLYANVHVEGGSAIFGVVASGSANVSIIEFYGR
jgi:hypothetical protein